MGTYAHIHRAGPLISSSGLCTHVPRHIDLNAETCNLSIHYTHIPHWPTYIETYRDKQNGNRSSVFLSFSTIKILIRKSTKSFSLGCGTILLVFVKISEFLKMKEMRKM